MAADHSVALGGEWPAKADLRNEITKPLPMVAPGTADPAAMTAEAAATQAREVLAAFNLALANNDAGALADCFLPEQAYWRDMVALTSHLRTFTGPDSIAAALLETTARCGLIREIECTDKVQFAVVNPVMMFINCEIVFKTTTPALDCSGKAVMLPFKDAASGTVLWKIWILSTWVESLTGCPEDESLLSSPGRDLTADTIETDVLIAGAGTSGLMTAARLKALGVDSIMIDRNAEIGAVWMNRYDSLKIHLPASNCEMPFSTYPKELQSPHFLTKYEVAKHLADYAAKFHLNAILSASITSATYDTSKQRWKVRLSTSDGSGQKTIVCKHFVQATGLGSQVPYLPAIEGKERYRGLSIHSTEYRNAKVLQQQGAKSVAVIGSANTAFDIMEDCQHAGLETTMVVRSPTYIFPYEYIMDPHSIGAYEHFPLAEADKMLNTFPTAVDAQFVRGLMAHLASCDPDRYIALAKAGFPVLDSTDPTVNLMHNLLERGGGHYLDTGGTESIANGAVAVRGLVEPVGFTASGLLLSDGSTLDVDAVIWCTGFADKDVRATASKLLGADNANDLVQSQGKEILGPQEIAARLDATWGLDVEGEIRGVWKRHLRMENYWVMGGVIQHQRWWSRALAQQIKLALNGALPAAYRAVPMPKKE